MVSKDKIIKGLIGATRPQIDMVRIYRMTGYSKNGSGKGSATVRKYKTGYKDQMSFFSFLKK